MASSVSGVVGAGRSVPGGAEWGEGRGAGAHVGRGQADPRQGPAGTGRGVPGK